MGSCGSKNKVAPAGQGESTILVIGLDNAGKTTLVSTLKGDYDPYIMPTVGFGGPAKAKVRGMNMTFFDLGGGAQIRKIWEGFYCDVHGIIFVVDAADQQRFIEAKEELHKSLDHPMLLGKPLLVLANKQDIVGSATASDVAQALGLDSIMMCKHSIQPSTAKVNPNDPQVDERIFEGLSWLNRVITSDAVKLAERIVNDQATYKAQRAEYDSQLLKKMRAMQEAGEEEHKGEQSGEQPAGPVCTICKEKPAVRKSGAAGWKPVCDACGTEAEEAKRAQREAEMKAAMEEIERLEAEEQKASA